MRPCELFRKFAIVVILALAPAAPAAAGFRECMQAHLAAALALHPSDGKELNLIPGREIPFYSSGERPHVRRLEDVFLVIQPADDIAAIAETLAHGRLDSKAIEALLRRHLAGSSGRPLSLLEVMPEIAKLKTNQQGECFGPNCHNATLRWFDPATGIKKTTVGEMERILGDSQHFRKIPAGEALRYGDVVVFRNGQDNGRLLHSGIYLSSDLIWNKVGKEQAHPYTFETLTGAARHYFIEVGEDLQIEFYRNVSPDGAHFE